MSAFGGKADLAQTSENVRSLIMSDKIRRLSITAGRRLNFLIMVRPLRSYWGQLQYQQAQVHMKSEQSNLCCISCGKPMRFARSISRPNGLPNLHTFECGHCGL